jgi:hypothetical protein
MTIEFRHPDGRPLELEPETRDWLNRLLEAIAAGNAEVAGTVTVAPGLELTAAQLQDLAEQGERA